MTGVASPPGMTSWRGTSLPPSGSPRSSGGGRIWVWSVKAWIAETLPRTTREVGACVAKECGIEYQGRSGQIALLHRLGMVHRESKAVSRKLDPEQQAGLIKAYEEL